MAGPAPKEIQGIPTGENTKILHLPTQERKWREKVAQHVRNIPGIDSSFTEEEATPPATQPAPKSYEMEKIGANRIGEEPNFSEADVKHFVGTLLEGDKGLSAGARTIPGNKAIHYLRRKFRLSKQKAA